MPKAAKPFVLDLPKIKENYTKGKFPYKIPCSSCQKLCGNTSIEIFDTRIKTYGNIDKLYENYVCTHCRKTKKITPVREIIRKSEDETNIEGKPIIKAALGYMPDGSLNYWWMHPFFQLPAEERQMIDTGDGYCTYVRIEKKKEVV